MNHRYLAPWAFICLSLLPATFCGCVALGIPSERYDDPSDRGGLFGPQRAAAPRALDAAPADSCATSGGACAADTWSEDGLDPDAGLGPKPAEVPWPKFHPLPTRPVFSPPPATVSN